MSLDDVSGPEPAEEEIPQEEPIEEKKEEATPTSEINGEEKSVEEIIKAAGGKVEEKKEEKGEEPKEEKKEHEPSPEHPRYKKIYGKMKHAERKAEKLEKEIETLKSQVKGVTDERAKERQQEIDTEINGLWKAYGDAISEGDGEEVIKIHKKIDELKSKKAAPSQKKEQKETTDEEIEEKVREKEAERAVERFKKRNLWFNENKDMRKYAIYTEKKLNAEGFDGTYEELLEEVETEVKARFVTKKTGLPSVAGAGSTKRMTSDNVIKLSDEQRKVARGYFVGKSPKEAEAAYIKILKKQGRSK